MNLSSQNTDNLFLLQIIQGYVQLNAKKLLAWYPLILPLATIILSYSQLFFKMTLKRFKSIVQPITFRCNRANQNNPTKSNNNKELSCYKYRSCNSEVL